MSQNFETGHAKNVANFEDLLAFCTAYGLRYNPAKASIRLPGLSAKLAEATLAMTTIVNLNPAWINAVDARQILFEPLAKRMTRVLNAVKASDLTPKFIEDVKSIVRKLQGTRATPKSPDVVDDPNTPEDESHQSHSASQMSFDHRIENLDKLIHLLASQPAFAPNETELSVAGLTLTLTAMKTANTAVTTAFVPLDNARIARDKALYAYKTGLVTLAADVKTYIKSVFGPDSPEYKQMSGYKFKSQHK